MIGIMLLDLKIGWRSSSVTYEHDILISKSANFLFVSVDDESSVYPTRNIIFKGAISFSSTA